MKFFITFLCLISSFLFPMSQAPIPSKNLHLGVTTLKYQDEQRARPVVIELWYPTHLEGPLDIADDAVWQHPQEVRDASLEKGKHPLIVMSHGHGGDRRDRSWIAEHLVKRGFIVASVEHYGNSWKTYNPMITLRFWERAKDVSFAISTLLKEKKLKGLVDEKRIGFIGYSLGGMTGLVLGGAQLENAKQTAVQFIKKYDEFEKIDFEKIDKSDFSEAEKNFQDDRIRAIALLSPATFSIPSSSLQRVQVPVALVASEEDEVLPHQQHGQKILQNVKKLKSKIFRNQSHYVFLNRVSDIGKKVLRPDIQAEDIQAAREEMHEKVGEFLADFFEENL